MGNQRERISEAPHQAKRRSLRVVYFNARSIVNKINEVRLYILDTDLDVIAITETWTHNGISNDYLDIFQHEGPLCRSWALIQSESFLFSNPFSHNQSPRPRTMEFKQK